MDMHPSIPEGYISVFEAARISGVRVELLQDKQWLRRRGAPFQQVAKGHPIFFHPDRLREWTDKTSQPRKYKSRGKYAARGKRKAAR